MWIITSNNSFPSNYTFPSPVGGENDLFFKEASNLITLIIADIYYLLFNIVSYCKLPVTEGNNTYFIIKLINWIVCLTM